MASSRTPKLEPSHPRLIVSVFVFFLFGAAILGRLFFLQVVKGDYYAALSRGQYTVYEELAPKRGEVVLQGVRREGDRVEIEFFPLALNKRFPRAYLVPSAIENKEETTKTLASLLGIPEEEVREKIRKENDPYEPLKDHLSDEEAKKLEELTLQGVVVAYGEDRFYPQGNLASHIIGFLGFKGETRQGQYGVEEYYEDTLKGNVGFLQGEIDRKGRLLAALKHLVNPPRDGSTLVLTIDYNIQFMVERALEELVGKWDADSGNIIIMEPSTGKIRALASRPAFDPNYYSDVEDISYFLNPAIHSRFEFGSVFKPVTIASAMNEGKITPNTTYEDTGEVKIGGYTIFNYDRKAHGVRTMTNVLELSLNTGAIFAERSLGNDLFRSYVERFGFHEKTGIDLAGEATGDILNLYKTPEINFATASFGQGIAVTPLEMVSAISAIANGGTMMRPYIVEEIIHADGTREAVASRPRREGVLTSETASRVTAMMVSAVKNGQYKKAQVPGYLVAAKTGTAQVPNESGTGYSDKTIHSVVGFAPAFDPKFIAFIQLNNPKGIRFAADSLTPTFRKIGEFILGYYGIPPDE